MEWSRTPVPEEIAAILTAAAQMPPRQPITAETVQHLTFATELARTHGARSESTPIAWHRKLPILATVWDSDWWSTTGERLATFCDRGTGTWSANGVRFLVHGWHAGSDAHIDDFATRQRYHFTMPSDTRLLLNPRFPLLLFGSTAAICGWQLGTEDTYLFHDGQEPMGGPSFWAWSPNGTIVTRTTTGSQVRPSSLHETRLQFWTRDGRLIADHTHNLPFRGTWHWRPDSRVVISCHHTHLSWWSHDGALLTSHLLPDRGTGSYHEDQYVAWHPDGQTVAVLSDQHVLLFDGDGTVIQAYPLPFGGGGSCLAWHPSGSMLSVGDWSSSIHTFAVDGTLLHSLLTWRRLSGFRVPFMLRWSADGSCLAVSSRDCSLYLYTLPPSAS